MTIIVWRAGLMACDTGVWSSDYIMTHETMDKVVRLPDGSLLGCAGEVSIIQSYVAWAREGFDPEKRPEPGEKLDDFGAMHATTEGVFQIDHKFRRANIGDAEFLVEGTGHEFAYGCLVAGCSAPETVALAIKYFSHCAGRVITHRLVEVEEAPPDPEVEDVMDEIAAEPIPASPGSREFYGL